MPQSFALNADGSDFRYADGCQVYCEALHKGRLVPYLRSLIGRPRYQGDEDPMGVGRVAPLVSRIPMESFELEIDGQSLISHWKFVEAGSEDAGGVLSAVVTLRHEIRPVQVRVHTRLCGTGFIERWLEVINLGDAPMALSHIAPLSGLLFLADDLSQHGADPQFELMEYPDMPQGYEGGMTRRALGPGTYSSRATNGRSGWGMPSFILKEGASGEAFVGMLEWSANWRMDFFVRAMPGEDRTCVCFSMAPDAPAPIRVIAPGETISSPIAHLGHMRASEVTHKAHRHIRSVSVPLTEKNALIGGARVVDGGLDWLRLEAAMAADMGMEYFLVDAGWYGDWRAGWYDSTGDWNPTRLGESLMEARAIIQDLGMKFGLWMEPESMGKASALRRQHPDWSLKRDGETVAQGRVLDMARDEVAAFVSGEVNRMLGEQKPDFFKIDYNTQDIHQGSENVVGGYLENGQYRYVQALYRIFDDIARRHPDLLMENCAAGGGRLDLGMLRRTHFSAVTDFSMLPRSILAVNNLSLVIPPERLRFYYGHMPAYHAYGSLDTQLRLLMFTNPLFVGFGRTADWMPDEEKAVFRRYIELYKEFIRPILVDCKMFHPQGMLAMDGYDPICQMECAARDGTKGFAAVFSLKPGDRDCRLRLAGVVPGRTYRVELMQAGGSFLASGEALAREGVAVRLAGALDSEMVLYVEV